MKLSWAPIAIENRHISPQNWVLQQLSLTFSPSAASLTPSFTSFQMGSKSGLNSFVKLSYFQNISCSDKFSARIEKWFNVAWLKNLSTFYCLGLRWILRLWDMYLKLADSHVEVASLRLFEADWDCLMLIETLWGWLCLFEANLDSLSQIQTL